MGPGRIGRRGLLAALMAPGLATVGCDADGERLEAVATGQLRIMVPNAAGGGYDTTARILALAIESLGRERPEIFNLLGAGGVAGLARTVGERGNADLVMMMGLGVVGAVHTNGARVGLADVTPVARLLGEPELVLVSSGSPYPDLGALVEAWARRPERLTVGGGSLPGGPDHLAAHLLAEAVGVDPRVVDYRTYDGGGPLLAALLRREVDVALSGVLETLDQARAGDVEVLAVSGPQRLPGIDAPTLGEGGVDLDFVNWRGLVAPPGLDAGARQRLVGLVTEVHDSSSWAGAERANGWTDDFLPGAEFGAFLREESDRVDDVLGRLGF